MSADLLPCPFCGGPGECFLNGSRTYTVMCHDDNEGCEFSPYGFAGTEAEAITLWNTRAPVATT